MKYLLFSTLLALYSCKTVRINPPAPEFKFIDELATLEPSLLFIETELNLKPYLMEAENSIDKNFTGRVEQCEGISYVYHFKRDPLAYKFNQTEVESIINGAFDLSLSYCPDCKVLFGADRCVLPRLTASCGIEEPKRQVRIAYQTDISISENFNIQSKTTLSSFKLLDPCKITVFQYDATATIEKEVRASLVKMEKEIDAQLSASPVHASIKDVWDELQNAITVAPFGYFYLRPQQIGLADLTLKNEGQRAFFTTQLIAQPLFSTNKLDLNYITLPKNTQIAKSSNESVLNLRTIASYDSINQYLSQNFSTITLNIQPKKTIQIDKITVLGPQGDRLVLAIHFTGSKTGTFYLISEPYIDEKQKLRVRNVDFEIQSKNLLLRSARWLLDSKIKEQIEESMSVDLGPILLESKNAIEKEINREVTAGVNLSGNISDLSVHRLLLTSGYLALDFELRGLLKLKIE